METTASIIAVAQLCEKVIKYIIAVSGARHEKQRLRSQVRSCHNLLLQLQDEAEDSEEAEEWSKTLKLLSTPVARLHESLSLAAAALSARDGIAEKLGWPFKEKDVEKLIEAIRCEMDMVTFALHNNATSLLIAINAGSKRNEQHLIEVKAALELRNENTNLTLRNINGELESIHTTQNDVRGRVEELHGRQDTEEALRKRQRILDWLTPIDHAAQQRDAISRRQSGTGGWLLNSQTYQDWLSVSNRTLFCPGIPGAGKTIFASIINADLWERYHDDPTVGLAHIFCNYRRHDEQGLVALLSGLLRQLVEKQGSLPTSVEDLYKSHMGDSDRAKTTASTLHLVGASFSKVFIVIDGLDECSTSEGCRTALISSLQNLQTKCHVNLLCTSRFIPEITERFKTAYHLEIQADENDVRTYINENMFQLPGFVRKSAELQELTIQKIVNAVRGMFLLAKLHLDSLIGKKSPKILRAALDKFATGSNAYDTAYGSAMERIRGQVPDQAELAMQTLAILTWWRRTVLSAQNLQALLGVEIGEAILDQDNCPDIEDIVSSCVGLVTLDEDSSVIRLVHYTTQEYLDRTHEQWFPEAHSMITDICSSFLALDRYANLALPSSNDEYLWLICVALKWSYHAPQATSSHLQIMRFLMQPINVRRTGYYLHMDEPYLLKYHTWKHAVEESSTNGLHFAADFGLEVEIVALLNRGCDIDALDMHYRTPLMVALGKLLEARKLRHRGKEAVVSKYAAIVGHLVRHGSAINYAIDSSHDLGGTTALHLAVDSGAEDVIRLLVSHGSTMTSRNEQGETPLHRALRKRSAPLEILLEAKPDLNSVAAGNHDILASASASGRPKAVTLLLDAGASLNGNNDSAKSAAEPNDQSPPSTPIHGRRNSWLEGHHPSWTDVMSGTPLQEARKGLDRASVSYFSDDNTYMNILRWHRVAEYEECIRILEQASQQKRESAVTVEQ